MRRNQPQREALHPAAIGEPSVKMLEIKNRYSRAGIFRQLTERMDERFFVGKNYGKPTVS